MIVGVPKEVKDNEFRVAQTPEGASELTHAGHQVLIQDQAGDGSNIPQERYVRAGAEIVPSADEVWDRADMVLIPGARAPKLVSREMVASMRPGSVIIDIAIDQRGCVETSRMTTHSNPTYLDEGVVHYCLGNMPVAEAHDLEWIPVGSAIPGAGP